MNPRQRMNIEHFISALYHSKFHTEGSRIELRRTQSKIGRRRRRNREL